MCTYPSQSVKISIHSCTFSKNFPIRRLMPFQYIPFFLILIYLVIYFLLIHVQIRHQRNLYQQNGRNAVFEFLVHRLMVLKSQLHILAVPSRSLVFMLADSLLQKLRHHEIRIAQQGRNPHHRSQHLGEERAAAVA